ncbi:DnaQ-like DNA polymerase III subunit [Mycobacterium phage Optimus]|uniref:DnaQ-like DNA polymerase III subunit n=2 Tax=Omegavirus TaxID=1623292 RepID=A0A3S9UB30_9CAUD|nr:DNA polymerase exonuclease subunit [Mycobacterium phage Optimus]AEJ92207.1 DnaQ-like DNA polymerase III subunit [Mycobacterium phage Optimus]AXQ52384.1 DnaQ-like DNA polymerase III subunit [Mycobacterium phage EricMillard]AYB69638.1 DnaQ-like DNA polymerase III subunit [Mycobacterium phage Kalah2]AZS07494.1 DnaQ-like DNA polymerase III subunit [Mycobacterium phage Duke13]
MSRQIIVVDTETGGLGPNAPVLEIAAVNVETGEEFRVVPFVTAAQLSSCEPEALAINRFYERRVFADMLEDAEGNKNAFDWLRSMLDGNVFAGSNPAFDAPLIAKLLNGEPWHHRKLALESYAAGVLGLPLDELPGLNKVCEILGVENEDPHSALGDARATAECFRILRGMAEHNRVQ